MTMKTIAKALLLVAGLLILAVPARAAESLVLTCSVCDHVDAKGTGLPPARDLRLTMTDLKTGQQLANLPVRTDANGHFAKSVKVDLRVHPALQSSVLASTNGQLLVIAEHDRFVAPCKPLTATSGPLAFTGSQTMLLLGVAAGLLLAGVLLLWVGTARGGRRAATP
jgi:hypothetical protein